MTTEKSSDPGRQLWAQLILAAGLVAAAFVLGYQTKTIGSGRSTVSIKGLAEKPIKADTAEWTVTAKAHGKDFPEAVRLLRASKKELLAFIAGQGFGPNAYQETAEQIEPAYVEEESERGRIRQVQKGFDATQDIVVRSNNLDLVSRSYRDILDFRSAGHSVGYQPPNYLVSNLEEIKISLIHAATDNAKLRALEFIKGSSADLGAIRSASQGAFYILSGRSDQEPDEYGGRYDKSTVDKIARVVVTVEYNLQ